MGVLILKYRFDLSRFKNYGLWVSISALIPILYETFGGVGFPKEYNQIVNTALGILVLLGILNNPVKECKGYLDDKK